MIRRIWSAYRFELDKALRHKLTYLGPALLVLFLLVLAWTGGIVRDGVSDYAFVAKATTAALNLPGLVFVFLFCGALVAAEVGSGTIRLALVRPVRRSELLAAKLMLGLSYAWALTVLVGLASWSAAWAFGELVGVTYGGEVVYTSSEMLWAYLGGAALSLAPQATAVAFALMLSAMSRNASVALGLTLGGWVTLDAVKYPLHISWGVFTTYLETPWAVFRDQCDAVPGQWAPEIYLCLAVSLASAALFTTLALWAFGRRNLQA